ncbi:MAG: hypothetical protein U0640_14190 [Phycisphaerales bacterium]
MHLSHHIATASALALAVSAQASLSRYTTVPPGGFAQAACYRITCGCTPISPGGDLQAGYGLGDDFHEQAFTGNNSASASASNNTGGAAGPINQSISGIAGLGYSRAQGSNAYTDGATFANAILDGGWNETFTISHPSLNGQPGYMVFRLHAGGTMHTTGGSGSTSVQVIPYKNNITLDMNPYYNRESADLIGSGYQYGQWAIASFGQPESRNVDGFVTMSVPITFGTPFTLGVWTRFIGGQRSSGGFNLPSAGSFDFSTRGIEWAGITSIRSSNGTVITDANIASGSGINWTPPFEACDSIDFNNDTSFFDPQDIDAFLSVYSEGPCIPSSATCNDIDFNNDGSVFDPCDIDAFLLAFSEGPCTPCGQ